MPTILLRKIPGYASLPACFDSINGRLMKPRTLEAMRTQGRFSLFQSVAHRDVSDPA